MQQAAARLQVVNRRGEKGPIPTRSKRFYMKDRQWYFMTREGGHHGPYQNLTEAKKELSLYLRRCGVVRFSI